MMDATYIYLGAFIAIAVIVGLAVSGKLKFSLSKNKLDFEASKQEAKNKVSATNVTNESEVKIKKGDNHDITVDRIDGKSKVDIQ
ncbi:MAG: hypothetical protein Q7U23_06815 [Methylococcales bacterium]|nr:hypothetical protein [Methylococcales bacterium]MDP3007772.1 hypothetical protein [Methylococcales bacterium]